MCFVSSNAVAVVLHSKSSLKLIFLFLYSWLRPSNVNFTKDPDYYSTHTLFYEPFFSNLRFVHDIACPGD